VIWVKRMPLLAFAPIVGEPDQAGKRRRKALASLLRLGESSTVCVSQRNDHG
jgi:hypothetical protein